MAFSLFYFQLDICFESEPRVTPELLILEEYGYRWNGDSA